MGERSNQAIIINMITGRRGNDLEKVVLGGRKCA